MKTKFFLLLFVYISLCSRCADEQIITPPPPPEKEWELVWSDEFDYSGLPDPKKWNYEEAFVRNNEKQYYTFRLENLFVENGFLSMKCIKEQYPNRDYNNQSLASKPNQVWKTVDEYASYTSAAINTENKYSVTYGKIEIRAKLPYGKGVWPAIWTMGSNFYAVGWPECGEIDILEFAGNNPGFIHANFIYANPLTGNTAQDQVSKEVESPWTDFHLYSMEWDSKTILIKYDDIIYHSFDTKTAGGIYNKAQYILLDFALGGTMGGEIDDSTLPQEFQVDYVRVYQLKKLM